MERIAWQKESIFEIQLVQIQAQLPPLALPVTRQFSHHIILQSELQLKALLPLCELLLTITLPLS